MQPEPDTQVLPPRSGQEERAADAAAALEPVILQRWVGRYELIHRLAHGGMATVYLGRAKGKAGFEKVVAVKVIHPHLANEAEFVSMFLDEARIAARIHHPHVVEILDLGETDGAYHMVMEFIEGDNLAALVRALDGERLPISVTLQLLADTLAGLEAAHGLRDGDGLPYRLVHRDVSPHNILINLNGWAKVGDFGIMKAAGKASNTKTGELRGKLAYMSPEQARGGAVDLRTDLFAVGVIGWELLTGRRLFACETEAATLEKVIACEVPTIDCSADGERPEIDGARWPERAELAAGLDALLRRALDPDPAQRFSSAAQMLSEVKRLARLCEATAVGSGETGQDDCPEPRAYLGALMNRFFRARVDYARAALRRTGEYETLAAAATLSDTPKSRGWTVEATLQVPRQPTGSNPTLGDPQRERSPMQAERERPPTASHPSAPVNPSGSQSIVAASPLSHWILWLLLPMLGAGIAVIVMLAIDRSPQAVAPPQLSPTTEPVSHRPASAPSDEQSKPVQWYFTTSPPGATVLVDGQPWSEVTPARVQLPRGDETVEISLTLDGYQPKLLALVPLNDQNFNEVLEREPVEKPVEKPIEKPRARATSKAPTKLGSKPAEADSKPGKTPFKFQPAPESLKK